MTIDRRGSRPSPSARFRSETSRKEQRSDSIVVGGSRVNETVTSWPGPRTTGSSSRGTGSTVGRSAYRDELVAQEADETRVIQRTSRVMEFSPEGREIREGRKEC